MSVSATNAVVPRGELRLDEPLAPHTSWRVGGPAKRLYRPADREDLIVFLAGLPADEPLLWLGLGSNLLISDAGFPGTFIQTTGRLTGIQLLDPTRLRAEAVVSCAKVARFATRQRLVGVEFPAGIPGTMGGALAMNAGAWGGETWEHVTWVHTVDRCGSVFRNPPGDHAARMIEAAGLKGLRIGGAEVSPKHANFIINTGDASARDIALLIDRVQAEVARTSGIRLIPEVRRVGELS